MSIFKLNFKSTRLHWLILMLIVPALSFDLKQKPISLEYQVKAVFLFNFAQFVEWPAEVFQAADSPLIIGVLGPDPFGSYLDETVESEKVNGHPLQIERYTSASEVKNCHILFIHPDIVPKLDRVLPELKGRSILTVSDGNNFTKLGGMVRFFTENNKIKLRVNLEAVKEEDITISSKLLRLAEIVNPN